MTAKETATESMGALPGEASSEDIQERLNFIAAVRKGLRELDEGQGVSHEAVRQKFAEWLSG
jgi:predicted transcriptional regulator